MVSPVSDFIIIAIVSVTIAVLVITGDYIQYRWHMYREMRQVKRELERTRQQ